ncbi:MAG: ABC transporter ATP-binding protein [Desulfobacteraceae bacterium]|nr:MAG: ABC transporter ATP-binding protein [Desulfobacteraceae bacterium]
MGIQAGEIVSIIGANGAGKSTLLKTVSGLIKPRRGSIRFENASIVGIAPEKITRMGLVHIPEGRQILATLTVYDNLELGSIPLRSRSGLNRKFEEVFETFPVLKERAHQAGGTLSGGEQQMLAIGRALMGEPKLLMMDEPSLGLAPILINEIFKIIAVLREKKKTILLVEQNARKALLTSDRSYLLENGLIAMSGPSPEMINNQKIKDSYLGTR